MNAFINIIFKVCKDGLSVLDDVGGMWGGQEGMSVRRICCESENKEKNAKKVEN